MKRYFRAFHQLHKVHIAHALRDSLRHYSTANFRSDLRAAIVVSMVAIPLGMALGVASGVSPQSGLYTVIIGGLVIALLGGSKFQVSGPTAAFVALLAPIAARYGLEGLLLSGLLAGAILLIMSFARFGRFVSVIPYPVTTGFTFGIAVVIASIQLKDFFGLSLPHNPESFFERIHLYLQNAASIQANEAVVGLLTLVVLFAWPKVSKKIPAPLVALSMAGAVAYAAEQFGWFSVATIHSRFQFTLPGGVIGSGIPTSLPRLDFSFLLGFENFTETIKDLFPSALAIALLGAIESLLSAVVADSLTGEKHDPDAELFGLGVGNLLCPLFGGIAATGAIARTSTNIRYGAKSPLSSAMHALVVLITVLVLAPVISYIPMSALAALLIFIAYQMADFKHVKHLIRVAPASDVLILITCASLTALYDMVVGIGVGMVLASFLFTQRMAQLTEGKVIVSEDVKGKGDSRLKDKALIFEIRGPMFFGAAEKAMGSLDVIGSEIIHVTFNFSQVPAMDVTGLVAFESTVQKLLNKEIKVELVHVSNEVKTLLKKSDLLRAFV